MFRLTLIRQAGHRCQQHWRSYRTLALASVLMTTACSNDAVPVNATLRVTPEQHSTLIVEHHDAAGRCLYSTNSYVDIPVLLQLNSVDGSPIGDATLNVYVNFAANTYSGLPAMALYDDLNGNGVVDEDTELISGPDDDIAQVATGRWTGARGLLLRINLSCSFKGELFAFTGGVSGRAVIEVTTSEIIEPDEYLIDESAANQRRGGGEAQPVSSQGDRP